MQYPKFFNEIEAIKLKDNLSNFLGTFEGGLIEFSYLDVVKSAGHSCPTVAGAYIMTLVGLKELYQDEIPIRGEIHVSFQEDGVSGVSGVISNVITQITGATYKNGFKGLNGKFKRDNLITYNANISTNVKFTRLDNNHSVEVIYNPSVLNDNPLISMLMQKIIQGKATKEEKLTFGTLWQQKVETIFQNIDKVIKIQ
jgi:formylmethanofuran dehydrogenase subunit E